LINYKIHKYLKIYKILYINKIILDVIKIIEIINLQYIIIYHLIHLLIKININIKIIIVIIELINKISHQKLLNKFMIDKWQIQPMVIYNIIMVIYKNVDICIFQYRE
jgi:hypothetical protein